MRGNLADHHDHASNVHLRPLAILVLRPSNHHVVQEFADSELDVKPRPPDLASLARVWQPGRARYTASTEDSIQPTEFETLHWTFVLIFFQMIYSLTNFRHEMDLWIFWLILSTKFALTFQANGDHSSLILDEKISQLVHEPQIVIRQFMLKGQHRNSSNVKKVINL
jgi:hypothetical protein